MSQRWAFAAPVLLASCTLVDLDGLSSGGGASTAASGTTGSMLSGSTVGTGSNASVASSSTSTGGPCGALSACHDQCVDLASSVQHCGRCDRDCEGGACIAGECQPVLLFAGAADTATGVALTDTEVVWNGSPDVRVLPKNAAPGTMPRSVTNVRGARIAVDGNEAYLTGYPMVRVDLQTGAETQSFGVDCSSEVWLHGGFVYCSGFAEGVHRFLPDGTDHRILLPTTDNYTGIYADAVGVYFRGAGGVVFGMPADLASPPSVVFDAEPVDGSFAVIGRTLYTLGSTSLWSVSLDSGITEQVVTNTNHYGMLAGDARAIYFGQWDTNLVRRRSLDGQPDVTFFTDGMDTDVLALDDRYLFFTDHLTNRLYRLVR